MFKPLLRAAAAIALIIPATGCEKIDNNRLPPANVNLIFYTIGDWQRYGVSGAGQTRNFIKQDGLPVGYPYKASEYTGFGGIMLVCDPNGEFLAYDLACPVEKNPDVRVQVDSDNPIAGLAKCPKCGSVYNLFGKGGPVEGEALKIKVGLENYFVGVGSQTPPYAYVKR